jgi:hypothetical protein
MLTGYVAAYSTGDSSQMPRRLFLPGTIVIGRHFFFLCHGQTASSKVIHWNRIAQNRQNSYTPYIRSIDVYVL